MTPGTRLRQARSLRFATASEAARYLGIATPTYLAHENGTRNITWEQAEYYARKFRIRTEWLLSGRGDMSDDPATEKLTPLASSLARASSRHTGVNPLLALLQIGYSPDGLLRPLAGARDGEPAQLPPLDQSQGFIAEIAAADPTAVEARREIVLPGAPRINLKFVVDDFLRLPTDAFATDFAVSVRFGDGDLIEGSSPIDRMIVNPLDRDIARPGFFAAIIGGRIKPVLADIHPDAEGARGVALTATRFAFAEFWPEVQVADLADRMIGRAERISVSLSPEIERGFKASIYETQRRSAAALPGPMIAPGRLPSPAASPMPMAGVAPRQTILRAPV